MKGKVYSNNSFCAMIGTWDPPIAEFKEIFIELIAYCNFNQLCPLIIFINPNPSIFYAEKYYRDYLDVYARIEFLNTLGIRNSIIMEFEKKDIEASAKDFFIALDNVVSIKELWLGGLQSFGTGDSGSQQEILKQCALRNIETRILDKTLKIKIGRSYLYKHFVNFDFEKTKEITGFFPTLNHKLSKTVNFFDGEFLIYNSNTPFVFSEQEKQLTTIQNGNILNKNQLKFPWITIIKKTS